MSSNEVIVVRLSLSVVDDKYNLNIKYYVIYKLDIIIISYSIMKNNTLLKGTNVIALIMIIQQSNSCYLKIKYQDYILINYVIFISINTIKFLI